MYVYKKTEKQLWTVGYYNPHGRWESESDHNNQDDAAWRVHWLNGGDHQSNPNNLSDAATRYFKERARLRGDIWDDSK